MMGIWGTREELLLGAAVLRHGIQDWNVIADELRIRDCPYTFTPEVCKSKYEDLQQRYSGSMALLYEELKKARIEDLKKAIKQSDDTIGSLESKLEVLKAEEKNEKKDDCENDLESPVSHTTSHKPEKVKSSTEETSTDELSAGSFIQKTRINWSPESQVPAASADDNEAKLEVSQSFEQTKESQSKLEVLEAEKNEKKDVCENDLESLVSHTPSHKLEKDKPSTEETSKDDLYAGSFTHETSTNWSPKSQVSAASAVDNETKPEVLQSIEQAIVSQSKVEVFKDEKNEKKDDCENGLESPISHLPSQKLENVISSTEEKSKGDLETKPEVSQSTEQAKVSQSNLEVIKAEKNEKKDDCENNLESPVSHLPSQKLEKVELSTKETSKDGLSSGSFTHKRRKNRSPESQVPIASASDNEAMPEVSQSTEQTQVLNADSLSLTLYEIQARCCTKRRGKRKRKDCGSNIKEAASVEESDLLDSADVSSRCKESSTGNCGEVAKISVDVDDKKNKNLKKHSAEDLIKILDSIFETNGASAFRRRLDSQKRGMYKKMIRQHMDFDTIRSRINSQAIESTSKLFRDLLLLTNNVLVFYSKITREYKTAFLLRDIVMKKIRESFKCSSNISSNKVIEPSDSVKLPVQNLHVEPRSVRQGNRKIIAKDDGSNSSASSQGAKKPVKADPSSPSTESLNVMKKAFGRQKKVEPVTSSQKTATPVKGKKRVRTNS